MKAKYLLLLLSMSPFSLGSTGGIAQENDLSISEEVEQIKNMEITHIDATTVPDGVRSV